MVASLVFGVYLGLNGFTTGIIDGTLDFAGYNSGYVSEGDSEIASLLTPISLERPWCGFVGG